MQDLSENLKVLQHKKILVTGATGFIGSNLLRRLVAHGCEVTALIRPSSDLWRLQDIRDQIRIIQGDLSDLHPEDWNAQAPNTQIIFHLGGIGVHPSEDDDDTVILQTNVVGTLRLLQYARTVGSERFIYCGSCFEYRPGKNLSEDKAPQPNTEYGVSNGAAWMMTNMYHHKYGLPVVSLRPFTIYGPFEAQKRLIPYTILSALDGHNIELTPGEQRRDFIYIDDAVDAFIQAATQEGIIGRTFNIASGRPRTIKNVVETVMNLIDTPAKPVFGAKPYRETEMWMISGDTRRARKYLHWKAATSLKTGLRKTVDWFKANRSKYKEYQDQHVRT